MLVMGIDQSLSSTGVFILKDEEVIHHANIKSNPSVGDKFLRVWLISKSIFALVDEYKPDLVCIEGLSMGSRAGQLGDLGGLQHYIVITLQHMMGHKVLVVEPKTLKKNATGNGNADKWKMFDACPQNIKDILAADYKFSSREAKNPTGSGFDVCDAFHLANYGIKIQKN